MNSSSSYPTTTSSSSSSSVRHVFSTSNHIPINSKTGILVSEKQRGNPVLRLLRLIPWQFSPDIVPDYVMGSTCAIFLSIKYHLLHPKYVERRITELGRTFRLRILLVYVDDLNSTKALFDLNKICFMSDVTLILAWSNEECARYIETFKNYEDKPSTSIQKKTDSGFVPRLTKSLTSVKPINKTDVITLMESFSTLKNICEADEATLHLCPGLGDKKVRKLYQALHQPFQKGGSKKKCKTEDVDTSETVVELDS